MPFPTTLPTAALQRLIDGALDFDLNFTRQTAEDAYDLLGYGMGVAMPKDVVVSATSMEGLTPEHNKAVLQGLMDSCGPDAGPSAKAFDWSMLIPILMDLINRFFKRK